MASASDEEDGPAGQTRPPGRWWQRDGGQLRPGPLAARTAVVLLVVLAAALLVVVLYLVRELLVLIFLAALLASALHVPVDFLEKRGLPRIAAVIVPYLLLGGLLILFGLLVLPSLALELAAFVEDLPQLVEQLRVWLGDLLSVQVVGSLEEDVGAALPSPDALLGVSLTALGVVTGLGVVIFTSVLLLIERDKIRRWFLQFLHPDQRAPFDDVTRNAIAKLGAYVRGQLVIMLIIGTGTAVAMLVLGVPFALAMGVLTFLLEAIPNFGPILAGIPVVLLGLSQSFTTALILLGWLLVLQALEGWVLTPVIQHKALKISPLVIFLAVVAGFSLFGVVGAIVAVPLVGTIDVILRDVVIPLRRKQIREAEGTLLLPDGSKAGATDMGSPGSEDEHSDETSD